MAFLSDSSEFPFQMKITAFGQKNMEKINNYGNEKSEHILFYNFYFQKKYKRNATKAIGNTQIGCLIVMIVCSLIDR